MEQKSDFIEIKPETLLLFFIFISLIISIAYNMNLLYTGYLPELSENKRLSERIDINGRGSVLENEIFGRLEIEALESEFKNICKKMYSGRNVIVNDDLFEKSFLENSGMNVLQKQHTPTKLVYKVQDAKRSIFYNPIVFSSRGYVQTRKYPIRTNPEFDKEYPNTILFYEVSENDIVVIQIFNNYVIFRPETL